MNIDMDSLKAFTLLVCSLVAVNLAAQDNSRALSEEESYALGNTRTLNTAEEVFTHDFGKGYSPNLLALGQAPSGAAPSADHAGMIVNELADGKKGNYLFTYKPGAKGKDGKIGSYTLTVHPVKREKGGMSFFTDQTGIIRWTRENRPATAKDPTIDSLPGSK